MIGESTDFSNWCYVYSVWHASLFRHSNLPTYEGANHSPWIISTTPQNISRKQPKNLGILRKCGTLQVTKHNEATYHNPSLGPSSSTSKPPNFFIQVARRKFPGLSISSAKASTNLATIRWQLWVWQSITCWFERVNISTGHIHIRIYI